MSRLIQETRSPNSGSQQLLPSRLRSSGAVQLEELPPNWSARSKSKKRSSTSSSSGKSRKVPRERGSNNTLGTRPGQGRNSDVVEVASVNSNMESSHSNSGDVGFDRHGTHVLHDNPVSLADPISSEGGPQTTSVNPPVDPDGSLRPGSSEAASNKRGPHVQHDNPISLGRDTLPEDGSQTLSVNPSLEHGSVSQHRQGSISSSGLGESNKHGTHAQHVNPLSLGRDPKPGDGSQTSSVNPSLEALSASGTPRSEAAGYSPLRASVGRHSRGSRDRSDRRRSRSRSRGSRSRARHEAVAEHHRRVNRLQHKERQRDMEKRSRHKPSSSYGRSRSRERSGSRTSVHSRHHSRSRSRERHSYRSSSWARSRGRSRSRSRRSSRRAPPKRSRSRSTGAMTRVARRPEVRQPAPRTPSPAASPIHVQPATISTAQLGTATVPSAVLRSPGTVPGSSSQGARGALFAAPDGPDWLHTSRGTPFGARHLDSAHMFTIPGAMSGSGSVIQADEQVAGDALYAARLAKRELDEQLRGTLELSQRLALIESAATLSTNIATLEKELEKGRHSSRGAVKRTAIAYPADLKLPLQVRDLQVLWKWMRKTKQVNLHNGWSSDEDQRHGIRESLSEAAVTDLLQHEQNYNVRLSPTQCYEFFFQKYYARLGTPDTMIIMGGLRKSEAETFSDYKQNLIFTAHMCGVEDAKLPERFLAGLSHADKLLLRQDPNSRIEATDTPHTVLDRWCGYLEMCAFANTDSVEKRTPAQAVTTIGAKPDTLPEALGHPVVSPSGSEHANNRLLAGVLNSFTEAVNSLSRVPQPDQGGGGGRRGDCYECGESSHFRRDCPLLQRKPPADEGKEEKCRHCGAVDHYSRGCKRPKDPPSGKETPGGSTKGTCSRCGKSKHDAGSCWASYHLDGTALDPSTKGAQAPKRGKGRRRF